MIRGCVDVGLTSIGSGGSFSWGRPGEWHIPRVQWCERLGLYSAQAAPAHRDDRAQHQTISTGHELFELETVRNSVDTIEAFLVSMRCVGVSRIYQPPFGIPQGRSLS